MFLVQLNLMIMMIEAPSRHVHYDEAAVAVVTISDPVELVDLHIDTVMMM